MKPSTIIGIVLVGVVSLSIVVAVPIMSARDNRREPGFDARYAPRSIPMEVVIEASASQYAEAVRGAIHRIDGVAGCTLLVEGSRGDVRVMGALGTPCGADSTKEGTTTYCADGTRTVQLQNVVEFGRQVDVSEHELTHTLGHRAHDEWGLMSDSAWPPVVTDRDTAELRRRCP